ncbi:hypothetical protein DC094_04735 [Pelagibaculum spongiae]|uniref:Uncharacterized protein n=1 Tax=Pelagibaculum spongiae TaxID=2080658 RepID=A0A2V1H537_9GAMM|nr:hypothetical protein DC094_04735 [Pelagibaculum spongiae]
MKITAAIYTLIMLCTVLLAPYQLPVPKIGGVLDAGYHWTCSSSKTTGFRCGHPNVKAEDSKLVSKALTFVKLEKLATKSIPIKYRLNYTRLISEWLFITFLTLIWMLAFQFSNTPNKKKQVGV